MGRCSSRGSWACTACLALSVALAKLNPQDAPGALTSAVRAAVVACSREPFQDGRLPGSRVRVFKHSPAGEISPSGEATRGLGPEHEPPHAAGLSVGIEAESTEKAL